MDTVAAASSGDGAVEDGWYTLEFCRLRLGTMALGATGLVEETAPRPTASLARSKLAWLVLPTGTPPVAGAVLAAVGGCAKDEEEDVRLRVRALRDDDDER